MKTPLSRRALLRGAGVVLSLPWLEALAPRVAHAAGGSIPRRLLICAFPNGAPHDWWSTAPAFGTSVSGDAFTLPNVLTPFQPIKHKLMMVSRLGNYTWSNDGDKPTPSVEPSHARCMSAVTTCIDADEVARKAKLPLDSAVRSTTSVDQLIAQTLQGQTGLNSMQTGLGVKPGFFDYRSYAYNQVLSWKSPTEPLKRNVNPRVIFDALVGSGSAQTPAELARLKAREKSVLDAVREDTNRIKKRVSSRDQQVLDQYLTTVRSLEIATDQVAATCRTLAVPSAVPEPPGPQQGLSQGQDGYDHELHADVMNDLITLAFECDRTRVVTHLLDDARSEFEYRNIPAADRTRVGLAYNAGSSLHYHGCQHGEGELADTTENGKYKIVKPSNRDFAAINAWMGRKVAELALKLDAIPEGDGTVLDHTTLVFLSEMRTHDHDAFDLPVLIVGGNGALKQNTHISYGSVGNDRQLRDMWYTLMRNVFGMPVTSFGEDARGVANAELTEILA
ncbi:DUF1552 domain-containing protein [Hyalangium versicolor]|uniref:DUF1552 domain-containing protein n=1 Tax=Hyalangium versicolor TaxID=2861190 RepID=UPI001CCEFBDF|nr:DUF1552 domain-containing protein [Hyalangium versicolor]